MGSHNGSVGSAERQSQKDMAREIKQNFMSMLDQLDFEKKELDHKRKQKKDDDPQNLNEIIPTLQQCCQSKSKRAEAQPKATTAKRT